MSRTYTKTDPSSSDPPQQSLFPVAQFFGGERGVHHYDDVARGDGEAVQDHHEPEPGVLTQEFREQQQPHPPEENREEQGQQRPQQQQQQAGNSAMKKQGSFARRLSSRAEMLWRRVL